MRTPTTPGIGELSVTVSVARFSTSPRLRMAFVGAVTVTVSRPAGSVPATRSYASWA
jgi:hypothetical protein